MRKQIIVPRAERIHIYMDRLDREVLNKIKDDELRAMILASLEKTDKIRVVAKSFFYLLCCTNLDYSDADNVIKFKKLIKLSYGGNSLVADESLFFKPSSPFLNGEIIKKLSGDFEFWRQYRNTEISQDVYFGLQRLRSAGYLSFENAKGDDPEDEQKEKAAVLLLKKLTKDWLGLEEDAKLLESFAEIAAINFAKIKSQGFLRNFNESSLSREELRILVSLDDEKQCETLIHQISGISEYRGFLDCVERVLNFKHFLTLVETDDKALDSYFKQHKFILSSEILREASGKIKTHTGSNVARNLFKMSQGLMDEVEAIIASHSNQQQNLSERDPLQSIKNFFEKNKIEQPVVNWGEMLLLPDAEFTVSFIGFRVYIESVPTALLDDLMRSLKFGDLTEAEQLIVIRVLQHNKHQIDLNIVDIVSHALANTNTSDSHRNFLRHFLKEQVEALEETDRKKLLSEYGDDWYDLLQCAQAEASRAESEAEVRAKKTAERQLIESQENTGRIKVTLSEHVELEQLQQELDANVVKAKTAAAECEKNSKTEDMSEQSNLKSTKDLKNKRLKLLKKQVKNTNSNIITKNRFSVFSEKNSNPSMSKSQDLVHPKKPPKAR